MNGNGGPHTAEGWVLKLGRDYPELSSSEMHVLLALGARHNRDYKAIHAKLDLMARDTHLSRRQIQRVLNDLVGFGLIQVKRGALPMSDQRGRTVFGNIYRFVKFDVPEVDLPPHARGDKVSRRKECEADPDGDATNDADGVTPEHGRGDTGDIDGVTPEKGDGVTSANSLLYPGGDYVPTPGEIPGRARDAGPDEPAARAASVRQNNVIVENGRTFLPGTGWLSGDANDGEPPARLNPGVSQCPLCGELFEGEYGAHIEASPKHKTRSESVPGNLAGVLRRHSAGPQAQPEFNPDPDPDWIRREHERRTKQRAETEKPVEAST